MVPRMKHPITAATEGDERTWRAGDAWICAVVLIVLSLCFNELLWSISRDSRVSANWLQSPAGTLVLRLFRTAWWLLVVFLFTRARSAREFFGRSGLSLPPNLTGWSAAWIGVAIGWLDLYGVIKGWVPQSQISSSYYSQGGAMWWSYVAYVVLLGPFYEETVMRGFLYRAFRGSYGIVASIFFVLCVVAYFHWGLLSRPLSFFCAVIGAVFLCVIRERTASLWNCVLFHVAYNATVTVQWWFYVFGLLAVLPLCARATFKKAPREAVPPPSSSETPTIK